MQNTSNRAGFTLVELTVVVVIMVVTMLAIYQSMITQERTYRYQAAAIDAQGTTRMGLGVLAAELREISASAGDLAGMGGSDLRVAGSDSITFRAFRKAGVVCVSSSAGLFADVWLMGEKFAAGDSAFVFVEGDTLTSDDDSWTQVRLTSVMDSAITSSCRSAWPDYGTQALVGIGLTSLGNMRRGGIVRSYNTVTYRAYQYGGNWVLGRRTGGGNLVPMVGPIMHPDSGGIRFRYFNRNDTQISPTTEAQRSTVARIEITVKGLSRGNGPGNSNYVDSLSTNVYLRGN